MGLKLDRMDEKIGTGDQVIVLREQTTQIVSLDRQDASALRLLWPRMEIVYAEDGMEVPPAGALAEAAGDGVDGDRNRNRDAQPAHAPSLYRYVVNPREAVGHFRLGKGTVIRIEPKVGIANVF